LYSIANYGYRYGDLLNIQNMKGESRRHAIRQRRKIESDEGVFPPQYGYGIT
jgi:hypothetical protein